jgi:hypothetical protein
LYKYNKYNKLNKLNKYKYLGKYALDVQGMMQREREEEQSDLSHFEDNPAEMGQVPYKFQFRNDSTVYLATVVIHYVDQSKKPREASFIRRGASVLICDITDTIKKIEVSASIDKSSVSKSPIIVRMIEPPPARGLPTCFILRGNSAFDSRVDIDYNCNVRL